MQSNNDRQKKAVNVFYSWQSDLPNSTNRTFILNALEKAATDIRSDDSIQIKPVIDRDTKGVPGSPDIATTILDKIDMCDVFVCDVSIITKKKSKSRPCPNPNVLLELGYALKKHGWNRIVLVVNTESGKIDKLPFDLNRNRALPYNLRAGQGKAAVEKELTSKLRVALMLILEDIGKRLDVQDMIRQIAIPSTEDLEWCISHRKKAIKELENAGFATRFEVLAVLSHPRSEYDQEMLLDAADRAQVGTSGWPIGIMDRGFDPMMPKPIGNGILYMFTDENKYFDYWSLRKDAGLYLLKSLFEDHHEVQPKSSIFFDTRIMRTTELLMYLSRLYHSLSVPSYSTVSITVQYTGIEDRTLRKVGHNNRGILPERICHEHLYEKQIEVKIELLQDTEQIIKHVKILLNEFFLLFNYTKYPDKTYQLIVENFIKGRTT